MNKKKITIFSILVFLFAFSFNSRIVKAYFIDKPEEKVNTFTIAELKEVTYEYYYLDENDNEILALDSATNNVFVGAQVNISNTIINSECSSFKHYVNGSLYNGSTYTVNADTTIKEVCVLRTYTITYNVNGGTLNNPKTTYTSMTETFDLPTPTRNNRGFSGWCNGNNDNCNNPARPYTVTQGSTGNITVTAKWNNTRHNVSHNNTNSNHYSFNGTNSVYDGNTYTATASPNNNYTITGVTVSMGNRTLDVGEDYTISENNGTYTITVPNVTGDLTINVTTQQTGGGGEFPCLVEGTNVMLWDGSTKKIENIKYSDLLKVWNHDLGTYGYEYAGWIEKVGVADEYTLVTFDDGSELRVVGNHSVFSMTLNKYVDINSDEFNIGDRVVNVKDGISYVTVTGIEHIEEEVRYYHVISSRYFNLITNNILTTYEIYNNVSNFMGFDENLKWQKTEEVRSDMYTYDDFLYLDRYLFKVFRLEETKYLVENGLVTPEQFEDLYTNYLMDNDKKVIPPKNSSGNYLWMVTTSDDENPNDIVHQMGDSSIYQVPVPKNSNGFKYWYNHSDNKCYNPGDLIEVDSSMYFEAVYGEPEVVEETEEPVAEETTKEVAEETIEDVSTEPVLEETITDPIKDNPEEE